LRYGAERWRKGAEPRIAAQWRNKGCAMAQERCSAKDPFPDRCAMAQEIGAMAQPRVGMKTAATSSSSSQPQTLTRPIPLLSQNFQISNPKTSIINLKFHPKSFINTNPTPNSSIP
jgi:hypothetical protein